MRVVDFIVCEDIRAEIGNKFSLMGVFNESMNIEADSNFKWPAPLKMAFFIRMFREEADRSASSNPVDFTFGVMSDTVGELARANGQSVFASADAPYITIVLNFPPLVIQSPGKLRFDFRLGGQIFSLNDFEISFRSR